MTDQLQEHVTAALTQQAEQAPVGTPPLGAIEAAGRRAVFRSRLALAAAAGVAVLTAASGTVVVAARFTSGLPAATPSASATAKPSASSAHLPASGTRGSLGQDAAFLAAVRSRLLRETRLGQTAVALGAEVDVTVRYAGDTPAGRVVVGDIARRDGTGGSELAVWVGPRGAGAAVLDSVGNAGEEWDGTVSRLFRSDGRWWLLAFAAGEVARAEVSWHPVYTATGPGTRQWSALSTVDGLFLGAAPGQAVAARVRLHQPGKPVVDQPAIEDSEELNDPSFFPVELSAVAPLPARTDLRGADRELTTWLVNQVCTAVGAAVEDVEVAVRWSRAPGGGGDPQVLAVIRLPGGGTLLGYAAGRPGTSVIQVVPVPARQAESVPMVYATPEAVTVVAPSMVGATVRVRRDGRTLATTTLDPSGYCVATLPAGRDSSGVVGLEVQVAPPNAAPRTVSLGDSARKDPFDLRPR